MGKWDKYKGKLPEQNLVNNPHADKIQAARNLLVGVDITEVLKTYAELKHEKEILEAKIKQYNVELEARVLEIHDHYDAQGLTSVSVTNVGRFTTSFEPYPQFLDKQAAIEWIKPRFPELVKEDVNFQSLKSTLKSELEEGGAELPEEEDGLKLFMKKKITFIKAK